MARTEEETFRARNLRELEARERLRDRTEEKMWRDRDKREADEERERIRERNARVAEVVDILEEAFLNLLPGSTVSVDGASTGSAYINFQPATVYQTRNLVQPTVDVHGCHIRVSDHPPGPKADADWYVAAGPDGFGVHWSIVIAYYASTMHYTNAIDGLVEAQPWLAAVPNNDAVYDNLIHGVARQIESRRARINALLKDRRKHIAEIKLLILQARHLYAFCMDLIKREYVWDDGDNFNLYFYSGIKRYNAPKWRVIPDYYIADIGLLSEWVEPYNDEDED